MLPIVSTEQRSDCGYERRQTSQEVCQRAFQNVDAPLRRAIFAKMDKRLFEELRSIMKRASPAERIPTGEKGSSAVAIAIAMAITVGLCGCTRA